jgi:hypothetical protein
MGSLVAASGQLSAAIGAPKRAQYQSILDGKDWRNPIITIQDDGVNVRAKGIAGTKHIPVTELKRLLISLPVSSWPYGRVIAQSDQGILPLPPDEYLRRMAEIRTQVAGILKELDITATFWPSS